MSHTKDTDLKPDGTVVFGMIDQGTLRLLSKPTEWLVEYFGDLWHAESRTLTVQSGSIFGRFLIHYRESVATEKEALNDKISLRETFVEGREFTGKVEALRRDHNVLVLLRKVEELETVETLNPVTEQIEAVERLAGNAADEFNDLLGSVSDGLSDLLGDPKVIREKEIAHKLSTVHDAATKASVLARQLLIYSRRARLVKAAVGSEMFIGNVVDRFAKDIPSTLKVETKFKDDLWDIDADETLLHQVMVNILENARQATFGRGTINLTARNFVLEDRAVSEAFECDPGQYVIVTISDNGVGMRKKTRERVFEPFFTTKESEAGIGLGLTNALGIVRQHGGHILCTSALGQGTTFSLYLPRYISIDAEIAEDGCPRLDPQEDKAPGVLVVEDETLLRNLVMTLCRKNGYRAFGAADGQEALEFIQTKPDEVFAAVIDLAMPRMTGTEFFRRINAGGIHLPVIVASGFLIDRDQFIEETGGTPFAIFSKPYQLNELIAKIDELRDKSGVALPA